MKIEIEFLNEEQVRRLTKAIWSVSGVMLRVDGELYGYDDRYPRASKLGYPLDEDCYFPPQDELLP